MTNTERKSIDAIAAYYEFKGVEHAKEVIGREVRTLRNEIDDAQDRGEDYSKLCAQLDDASRRYKIIEKKYEEAYAKLKPHFQK